MKSNPLNPTQDGAILSNSEHQYLLLKSAEVFFALPILSVREILEPSEITRVPMAPSWLLGLANLRGQVLPVIDLSARLGIQRQEPAPRPVLIVVDIVMRQGTFQRGLIIDSVGGITDAEEDQIRPYDDVGVTIATEYIRGLLPVAPHFAILLDLERVFAATQEIVT
jgi:purine-binding chemotaxis protein CheW